MFARSADQTRQGQAIQRVNERWGSDALDRAGRESIGRAVCKKKYTPFVFPLEYDTNDNSNTSTTGQDPMLVRVGVERRFGCRAHHHLRMAVIAQHGCRPGWEPFGQWSRQKALDIARRETARRNKKIRSSTTSGSATTHTTEDEVSLSSAEDGPTAAAAAVCGLPTHAQNNFRSLCWNGNCLVKHESRYDDVQEECRMLLAQQKAQEKEAAAAKREATRLVEHENGRNNNNNKSKTRAGKTGRPTKKQKR